MPTIITEVEVDVKLDDFSDREILEEVLHRMEFSNSFQTNLQETVSKFLDDEWECNTALDMMKLEALQRHYKDKTLEEIEEFFTN